MKKRILHIAEAAGGVDSYIYMLIKNFDDKYEHILLVSQNYNVEKYDKLTNIIKTIQIHMEHTLSLKDFKTVNEVKKIIKLEKPDIIYCHSTKAGFLGRLANNKKYIPLIYNPHGWCFDMNNKKSKKMLYIAMEKFLAKKTTSIICISNHELNEAKKRNICKQNKLTLIYNGIDYKKIIEEKAKFTISRKEVGFNNSDVIIGQCGRLCEQKGTDFFVEVAKNLHSISEKYKFMLVGDGPWLEKIKKSILEYDLDKYFYITGWIDNPLEYVNLFDIACLFSRWEGFGFVIEEYKALNKQIIASNSGAIPELIENSLECNDSYKIAEKIDKLDSSLNKIYDLKYDIAKCVIKTEKLIDEILKG